VRALGMGGAFVAAGEGIGAVQHNPALLGENTTLPASRTRSVSPTSSMTLKTSIPSQTLPRRSRSSTAWIKEESVFRPPPRPEQGSASSVSAQVSVTTT
jgi:hypothetical protein